MQMYDSDEEIMMRLRNSVIMYKGEPIFVASVNARGDIRYQTVPLVHGDVQHKVSFDQLQQWGNAQTYTLGYMNTIVRDLELDTVVYLTRLPARRTRQGLCSENVLVKPTNDILRRTGGFSFSHCISSPGFREMLLGQYRSIEEVFSKLIDAEPNTAYAISADFALRIDELEQITLLYKGSKAAVCSDLDKLTFRVPKKQAWLREKMSYNNLRIA